MKKLISIVVALFTLSILLNSWSGIIANQVAEYIVPAQTGKAIFTSSIQLQRSLVSASIALAVNENSFFDEANQRIEVTTKIIKAMALDKEDNKTLLLEAIEKLRTNLQALKAKRDKGFPVSKEELLDLNLEVEAIASDLNQLSRSYWGDNLDLFEELISNYEKVNHGIRIFQVLSLLIFTYLLFSIYKKNQAEIEVKRKEKLNDLLFSSLSESVFLCDHNGVIKSCNYSCSIITGVTPQEMIGNHLGEYIQNEKFRKSFGIQTLKDVMSRGDNFSSLIMSATINNEEKWLSLNSQPIAEDRDDCSFSTILSIRDVTDSIEAEKLIKNQQIQLVESSKLQSIGEMASGIAHEINNPLAIISTSTSRLSRKADRQESIGSEDVKSATDKISKTITRMAKIVQSLLTMSRGGAEKYDKVTIGKVVDIALDFCQPILESDCITLNLDELEKDISIDCYTTQISQVLLNLVKNSADAIQHIPDKWIKIRTIDGPKFLRIEVTDSGKGIDSEIRDQILMPFYTTKPVGEGTGLGLSISRKIIENHFGEFGIDDSNENTCFFLELPKKQCDKVPTPDFKELA